MSVRTYTADQLPGVARQLTAGRTVIHVVPATDNVGWAATRTWEFARALASGERRIALFDLSLERPALDMMAQNKADEGIVDAFLYGVSLSHVARQQDVPSLYFIGVGSRTNQSAEVWSSRRWDKLARGFANEQAVLIAYVPPGALNRCALAADGMLVLAPDGYDPALDVAPGIARKIKAGTPLIGVVTTAAEVAEPAVAPPIAPESPGDTDVTRVWDISPSETPQPVREEPAEEEAPLRVSIPVVQPVAPDTPDMDEFSGPTDEIDAIDLTPAIDQTPEPILDLELPEPGVARESVDTSPVPDIEPAFDTEVTEEYAPRPSRPSRPSIPDTPYDGPPIFEPSQRKPIGNVLFWAGSAVAVAAVVGGYVIWNGRDQGGGVGAPPAQASEAPQQTEETLAPVAATPPPVPVEPLAESDSLYYAVQAAALNSLEDAMEHGRDLQRGNRPVTVSPVRIGGRIWYRVIVGAFPSPEAADAGRRALWEDGLVDTGDGTILRTPRVFSLGRRNTIDSARVEAADLWDRGIPAYVLPHGNGGIVAVGAFVRPEQASIAESMLTAASLATTLAPRLGSTQ